MHFQFTSLALFVVFFNCAAGLAAKTFIMHVNSIAKNPLGLLVYPEGRWGQFPMTHVTVVTEHGAQVPILYLDYNYTPSDVMPPWTSSEYSAATSSPNHFVLKRRGVVIAQIANATTQSCAIYDAKAESLLATCDNVIAHPWFELRNHGKKLASFYPLARGSDDLRFSVEDNTSDIVSKAALAIASLRKWHMLGQVK